jgi:hypothetical protein
MSRSRILDLERRRWNRRNVKTGWTGKLKVLSADKLWILKRCRQSLTMPNAKDEFLLPNANPNLSIEDLMSMVRPSHLGVTICIHLNTGKIEE